jgi:outer membrane receptor protein involved in Fe transport
MQLFYMNSYVAGRRAGTVRGRLDTHQALEQLLRGTGLEAVYTSDTEATIQLAGDANAGAPDTHSDESAPRTPAPPASQGKSTDQTANGEPLGEVIVTAQKTGAERLQDVPVPIAVVGASDLAATNQFRLSEYGSQVPGLSVTSTDSAGAPMLAIRGIAPAPFGNPTVGVVLDGVPLGSEITFGGGSVTPDLDPSDLKQIEVLRGPQGTLYGSASMGGLLVYQTVDPSVAAFGGRAEVGLAGVKNAGHPGYEVSGAVNAPVSDTLAVRASGFSRWEPGYIDNVQSGGRGVNDTQITGGLLSALLQPSGIFSLKLTALFNDNKQWGEPFVTIGSGVDELQQQFMPNAGRQVSKLEAYAATATAKIGMVNLTSVTGYNINDVYTPLDNSVNDAPLVSLAYPTSHVMEIDAVRDNKFTQELRATTPLGDHLQWLVGAYYSHETAHSYSKYVATQADSTPIGTFAFLATGDGFSEWAGFTDLTYRLNDRFDVQVGGRRSHMVQTFTSVDNGLIVPIVDGVNASSFVYPEVSATEQSTTYLLTPRFRITPDIMVYARFASGFRPGGTNVGLLPPDLPRAFKPDKTQNYEVGVKADLVDGRLYVEGSLYRIDWKDIQIFLNVPGSTFGYYSNGSQAKSQGVELSLNARPLHGLHVGAWVTLGDSVLTSDEPPDSATYGVSGNRLPFSSRFSGSASIDYTVPVTSRATASLGATLSYVGNRLGAFQPTVERAYYPAYSKSDFHADLDFSNWTWSLYLNNAFDRRGIVGGGLGSFYPSAVYIIEPRTIGGSLKVAF